MVNTYQLYDIHKACFEGFVVVVVVVVILRSVPSASTT